MAYTEHTFNKTADLIAGQLSREIVLPGIVNHQSMDQFKGKEGDTLTARVPGRLPARNYPFRNDRSTPIQYDTYTEHAVAVTMGDRVYSGVRLSDEQRDFDLDGDWGDLVGDQSRAVAVGLEGRVADALTAQEMVTIGGVEPAMRAALIEARRVLGKFLVPQEGRVLVVGSDFEAAMLLDRDLTHALNVGDSRADSALGDATLGKLLGFKIVTSDLVEPDAAYAMIPSSFVLYTAAPAIPRSLSTARTINYEGFSLRWITDYDTDYLVDRSVVDSYVGIAPVLDRYVGLKPAETPRGVNKKEVHEEPIEGEFFTRAVKLTLDGESVYPDADDALGIETGVNENNAWTAPAGGGADEPVGP